MQDDIQDQGKVLGTWTNRFETDLSSTVTQYIFLAGGKFLYSSERSIAGDSALGQVTTVIADVEEGTYKILGDAKVELASEKKGTRIARMPENGILTIEGLEFHPSEESRPMTT